MLCAVLVHIGYGVLADNAHRAAPTSGTHGAKADAT
jgi:hypothetical protein